MFESQDEHLDHRELYYAMKMTKSQGRKLRALAIWGVITTVVSAVFIWFIHTHMYLESLTTLIMDLTLLVLVVSGVLMTVFGWSRKLQLNKQRQTVTGELEKFISENQNGANKETYFIDDCQILWPMEAGDIRDQDVGHETSISGARIDVTSAVDLSFLPTGETGRMLKPGSSLLIVLDYKKDIHISKLLENYGKDYFQRRFKINLKKYSALGALITLIFVFFGYLIWHGYDVESGFIFAFGSSAFLTVLMLTNQKNLDQWLDKHADYGSSSHTERLSGKMPITSGS
ncbi:hypothetical protein R2R70_18565 [Cobetia sp. SIMBA_158]|uniref:hypothetical protein n=1 Tax=Cobetia sp. SIMBA_158 TaxID=3081617 RepID=UPI00397FF295